MSLEQLLVDINSPARALVVGQPFYLSGEDHLQARAFNTATVSLAIVGRVMLPNGRVVPFAEPWTPGTAGTLDTRTVALPEGWLLNASVIVTSGTPTSSNCLLVLRMVHGLQSSAQALGTLAQGFVTASQEISWPLTLGGSGSSASPASFSVIRGILGTDPAAGVEISETVPANKRWRLNAMSFTFVTDATATGRGPIIIIDDGANILFASEPTGTVGASSTQTYTAGAAVPRQGASVLYTTFILPEQLIIGAGFRIRTQTQSLQAGDNYGAPRLLVEEWSV